jgi:hypothetical protein
VKSVSTCFFPDLWYSDSTQRSFSTCRHLSRPSIHISLNIIQGRSLPLVATTQSFFTFLHLFEKHISSHHTPPPLINTDYTSPYPHLFHRSQPTYLLSLLHPTLDCPSQEVRSHLTFSTHSPLEIPSPRIHSSCHCLLTGSSLSNYNFRSTPSRPFSFFFHHQVAKS